MNTYSRARLEIFNRIFQFSLSHQWGDGRVTGGSGDYSWVSDILTPPQIGDLIVLKSAPVSKFYLGWLVATDSKAGWPRYLVQSIDDGTQCWWHNVGIDHFNRKTLAENEHWRWSDKQYEFKDRWWKVCFKEKDAYLTVPLYPEFGPEFQVTLGTRKRHGMGDPALKKTFQDWRKVTKAMMAQFYDECAA